MLGWIDVLGLVAGVLTTVAVVPQIIKAKKTKEVEDVSPGMYFVLISGLALWVIYGVIKDDIAIIATNCLAFGLNIIMLVLIFRYRN